eukprot:3783641-Pyramimonas_sp.AAC.1
MQVRLFERASFKHTSAFSPLRPSTPDMTNSISPTPLTFAFLFALRSRSNGFRTSGGQFTNTPQRTSPFRTIAPSHRRNRARHYPTRMSPTASKAPLRARPRQQTPNASRH